MFAEIAHVDLCSCCVKIRCLIHTLWNYKHTLPWTPPAFHFAAACLLYGKGSHAQRLEEISATRKASIEHADIFLSWEYTVLHTFSWNLWSFQSHLSEALFFPDGALKKTHFFFCLALCFHSIQLQLPSSPILIVHYLWLKIGVICALFWREHWGQCYSNLSPFCPGQWCSI